MSDQTQCDISFQVCTTELGEVARRAKDFEARNVKVIGLSANGLDSHEKWIKDIDEVGKTSVQFPIVRFLASFLIQRYLI